MPSIIRSIPTYSGYIGGGEPAGASDALPGFSNRSTGAGAGGQRGEGVDSDRCRPSDGWLLDAGCVCLYVYLCVVRLRVALPWGRKKTLPTCRLSVSVWKALFPSEWVITFFFSNKSRHYPKVPSLSLSRLVANLDHTQAKHAMHCESLHAPNPDPNMDYILYVVLILKLSAQLVTRSVLLGNFRTCHYRIGYRFPSFPDAAAYAWFTCSNRVNSPPPNRCVLIVVKMLWREII